MRAHWQSLSPRDQRVLKIGGLLVAAALLWAWGWDPLTRARATLRQQAADNEAALAWMRPAATRLAEQGGLADTAPAVAAADGRSLLARVDAAARGAGLGAHLTAVEPLGDARVRVQLGGVDFDALVAWLESQAGQGVRMEEWRVNRAAGAGRVDAVLLLQEGMR